MKKSELLEDYCQKCGSTVGSTECCRNNVVMKKAIVTYKTTTYGCQKHHVENRLINWVGGSIDQTREIEFESNDRYTDDVVAMQAFRKWAANKMMSTTIGNTAEFIQPTGLELLNH
jgi:hypothetical protein